MKEELTTKMHSEFEVDNSTDIKHRCWSALTLISDINDTAQLETNAQRYNVTIEDIKRHSAEYYQLKNQS